METPVSFAPLAARLAARAAEIRPAPGARNDWDKVRALIVCLVLEMLIALCEALDARAAAEAARAVAGSASRPVATISHRAPRAGRQASSSEGRAPRLALVPEISAMAPKPDDALAGATERPTPTPTPTPTGPRLVWSRDPGPIRAVLAPPWRPCRETRLSRRGSSTPLSLRYRN